MAVTSDELSSFTQFAHDKLNNGGVESLEECLRLWREACETEAVLADLRDAEADIAAGRVHTVREADAITRGELGWPARSIDE